MYGCESQGWARDVNDRDETETLAFRDRDETFRFRDETETRHLQVSRRDRDVEVHIYGH